MVRGAQGKLIFRSRRLILSWAVGSYFRGHTDVRSSYIRNGMVDISRAKLTPSGITLYHIHPFEAGTAFSVDLIEYFNPNAHFVVGPFR